MNQAQRNLLSFLPIQKQNYMESSSKKVNHEGREDRISSLPDEVLTHILSLLSTRDAFRTTLLSSRWENLWAWVPNLSFCPYDGRTELWTEISENVYMKFIGMILLLHNSSIHKFYLNTTPQIDKSRVSAWIRTLVKRNVRDITISDVYTDDDHTNIWLPKSLFNCKTLECLKLGKWLDFNVPSSVHFPCLKILHVSLNTPSKELTAKLFCSCPVLEDLEFSVYFDSGRSNYNISSPALKKLSIMICATLLEDYDSVVTIDAPILQELKVSDDCFIRYILKQVPYLSKASIDVDVFGHYVKSLGNMHQLRELYMLVTEISGVKNLFLECCSVMALGVAIEKEWPIFPNLTHLRLQAIEECFESSCLSKWPTFPNLIHLHLNVNDDFGSKKLSHLLMRAPSLAFLVFEKEFPRDSDPEAFDPWEQQGVLACLQSSLKEVEVLKLEGSQSELLLIRYLLKSAQVLKILTLEHCTFEELSREEFQMEILAMPRCSKLCEVVFM